MRLSCAIFDLDGTVVDSMGAWLDGTAQVLVRRGITPPPELRDVIRPMSNQALLDYLRENFVPDLTAEQVHQEVMGYMEDFYRHQVQAKEGVANFLSLLKMEGVQCYLATNTRRPMALAALEHAGIAKYFKGVITSEEVGKTKSQGPDIYHWAMKRMGGVLGDTVVFEDALFAIRTAKAAGFRVAGVYDADSEEFQEEIKAISDYYITSFQELFHSQQLG